MPSLNKVFVMGNLTRDPETRFTPSGTAVAQFGLATNRRWRDRQSGEMREETTFVDIEVWGKQAELAGQYLVKGRPVFIEGRLKLDQWEDRNTGQKRSKLKIVGENFQFLGSRGDSASRGDSGGSGGGSTQRSAPASNQKSNKPAGGKTPDEDPGFDENFEASGDIPF
jgi:single-strand DNA-binding protein